jgi:hypothetical protein
LPAASDERAADLKADLALAKEEVARLKKALSRKVRNEAQIAIQVRDALEDLEPISVPPLPGIYTGKGPRSEEAAVLAMSDWQCGKTTETYDIATCEKRILMAGQKTLEIAAMRRQTARIDTLYLWLLGDMVEGEMIYPDQTWEIECGAAEQATKHVPRIAARLIGLLAQGFKRIVIRCVCGNHGRVGLPKAGANPRTNWDRVAYDTLSVHLAPLIAAGRIDFDVPDSFYCVTDILGWGHLITHGDRSIGSGGDTSVRKAINGWVQTIPGWRYLWFGHVHNPRVYTVNFHQAIANGSTESSNQYAHKQMHAATDPSQWLAFANRKHGIISLNQLFLSSRKP